MVPAEEVAEAPEEADALPPPAMTVKPPDAEVNVASVAVAKRPLVAEPLADEAVSEPLWDDELEKCNYLVSSR